MAVAFQNDLMSGVGR